MLYCFPGLVREFDIVDENTSTQAIPYDYKSVMHPSFNAFAIRGTKTILPLKYGVHVSHSSYPTELDLLHINNMYCGGNTHHYQHMHSICVCNKPYISTRIENFIDNNRVVSSATQWIEPVTAFQSNAFRYINSTTCCVTAQSEIGM